MHSNRYTLIFTTTITMVLAFILSSVFSSLDDLTQKNIQADIKKNILSSLGFSPSIEAPWTVENVEEIFNESIVSFVVNSSGEVVPNKLPEDIDPKLEEGLFPLYKKVVDGNTDGFAIPISGKGLWSTLKGFLYIENDFETVKGISIYDHKETPGLGAEVDNPKWKNLWPGKEIYQNGEVYLTVIKGNVDNNDKGAQYEIDGLSGATITSRGVTNMIAYWFGESGYSKLFKELNYES